MEFRQIKKYFKRLSFSRLANFLFYTFESKTGQTYCQSKPLELDIIPTKRCNLNCIFCIKYPTLGQKDMSLETFNQIANQLFPSSLRVRFCSGGEPFLNKNMTTFLTICKNYNLSTSLTTNGTLLNQHLCDFLINETSLDKISISLDGATSKTVQSIRRGINYPTVVKNIQLLSAAKRKFKKNNITLIIRFAVMKRNIRELPLIIHQAKSWGVDEVDVNYLYVANRIAKSESLFFSPKITKKYFDKAKDEAKKAGITLVLPPETTAHTTVHKCLLPWELMLIDTDASIHTCYRNLGKIPGNILSPHNFNQVWNNRYFQQVRATVNTRHPILSYCTDCSEKIGFNCQSSHFQKPSNDKFRHKLQ